MFRFKNFNYDAVGFISKNGINSQIQNIRKPLWAKQRDLGGFLRWRAISNSYWKQQKNMILRLFFRHLSLEKQVNYLQKSGVSLGSRIKNGRKVYVYMLRNLFAEVLYVGDNINEAPERIHMLKGLKNLNAYLEQEFRASF